MIRQSIDVVMSPALLPFHEVQGKCVVIIDILRATSSMCVAFETGVHRILPVATPEECAIFRDFDFLIAAERNAEKVDGFDLGNSPFEFRNPLLQGKNIAFTTTNGTKAIKLAKSLQAGQIVIGSYLNFDAVVKHLQQSNKPILLLCAGWKDKFNLEDTLFAGALVNALFVGEPAIEDAAIAAQALYVQHEQNEEALVRRSSHARRFQLMHLQTDDVAFCMQRNYTSKLPVLNGEFIEVLAEPSALSLS